MKTIFILFFLQSFFVYRETSGVELSSFIKLCKANEPNLNECVRDAGQKLIPQLANGIPEWNVPPIDPMVTPESSFTEKTGNNDYVINYKNIVQTGFSGIQIENADVDLEHSVMTFKLRYPYININADYSSKGRIYSFEAEGNGKANISVWNAYSSFVLKYHVVNDHVKVDSVIIGFSFDKIYLDYTNLVINGDPQLSKSASNFINENSKEIIDGFKPELDKFYGKITGEVLQTVFDVVPYSVLFPKN